MSARPLGDIIPGVVARAKRIASLCAFVATFDDPTDQCDLIRRLLAGEVITPGTADIMLEHFGLEFA